MKGNCNYSKKNGNDRRKMTEKFLNHQMSETANPVIKIIYEKVALELKLISVFFNQLIIFHNYQVSYSAIQMRKQIRLKLMNTRSFKKSTSNAQHPIYDDMHLESNHFVETNLERCRFDTCWEYRSLCRRVNCITTCKTTRGERPC